MDLKINIQQDLWEGIEKNYENESYSSAILDAVHLLTETIRNKTGLEGDGSSLIGQAFGGNAPLIQLNKMQTDSEKNIQKGMVDLLRGLYTSIRNPRSHDKHSDSKLDADAIIIFIDYLLKLIDKSKVHFDVSTFLERVFDEHYVKTKEYSDLLCNEIPKRQRLNIAIEVILQRKKGDIYNLGHFFASLIDILEENDIKQVYSVISEELKFTNADEDIRTILHIAPPKYWNMLNKVVKLRIENIIFKKVEAGSYDTETQKNRLGALGTWVEAEHLLNFDNLLKWTRMIINKLQSGNDEEKAYVEAFFWDKICEVNKNEITFPLKSYIKSGLKNKNSNVIEALKDVLEFEEEHPWRKVFEEQLEEFPELKYVDLPW